ncbi:MAG TPA: ABC transporter substrate-binding protein [Vicinamibacterales bacterium]|nr:ABC transporter substrate-binding protein [Vicinamibacterales bacterium]
MRQFFVFAVLAAGVAACRGSQAAPLRPVRIALHRDPIVFLPMRVAQTLGYYRQEGLDVDVSEVVGGTKAIEALLGGSVDVAAGTMSDAVQVAAEGGKIRGFLVLYTRPGDVLAVAPALSGRIHTIRDLKGRTVGVSAPGSATHQFLNFLLVTNGLLPEDVSVVSVGMSATSVAALEHGKVDAAVLIAGAIPTFEARHPGNRFLADTRTSAGARVVFRSEVFPSLSLLAQDRWLQQNADTALRLVRAVKRGMDWIRNRPAEQVREMLPETARMPDPEADLHAIGEMQRGMSSDGVMPPGSAELIRNYVAVSNPAVRAAHIDPASLYTNELASVK